MGSTIQGIEAKPQNLVNAGEAIHRSLGGERGDLLDHSQSFGEDMEVIVSDHSPKQSWTHARFQLSIIGKDFGVVMRAEDGRSGSDDPDRAFMLHDKNTGERWSYSDEHSGNQRPDWASRFLIELASAQQELESKK